MVIARADSTDGPTGNAPTEHSPAWAIGSSDKTEAEINYNCLRAHTAQGYHWTSPQATFWKLPANTTEWECQYIEDIKLTSSFVDQEDLQTKPRPDIINEQLMRWFVISHRAPSRYANTSHHLKQAMSSCEIVRSNDETVIGPGEVTSESTTKNELVSQCDDVHGVKLTRHKVVPVDSHALIMPWKRAIRRCPGSSWFVVPAMHKCVPIGDKIEVITCKVLVWQTSQS